MRLTDYPRILRNAVRQYGVVGTLRLLVVTLSYRVAA